MAITNTAAPPVPACVLEKLSEKSRLCVHRLRTSNIERLDLSNIPVSKLAAVLVLFYEKAGDLRVLLTTRSKLLRAHPGQTALPGGKVDESDRSLVHAAYREAHEEVALPLSTPHVHTLCLLRPFLSASQLIVTPVVAILSDVSVLDTLKPSAAEVDCIFDHPLEAILDPTLVKAEPLVPKQSEHWPYDTDYHNPSDVPIAAFENIEYRMHRFRTSEIAYGRRPIYELYPPGQTSTLELVRHRVEQYEAEVTLHQPISPALA